VPFATSNWLRGADEIGCPLFLAVRCRGARHHRRRGHVREALHGQRSCLQRYLQRVAARDLAEPAQTFSGPLDRAAIERKTKLEKDFAFPLRTDDLRVIREQAGGLNTASSVTELVRRYHELDDRLDQLELAVGVDESDLGQRGAVPGRPSQGKVKEGPQLANWRS
jgi:hypothetical protein